MANLRLFVAASLTAVACGALGCASATPKFNAVALEGVAHAAPPASNDARTFVVWSHREDSRTSRLVSVKGGDVVELGEADGAILVWAERAYRFGVETAEAPLYACDFTGDTQPMIDAKAEVHQGVLTDLQGPGRWIVSPGGETSGMNDFNDGVDLEGSAGPYVFVTSSEWGYSCGAHGNASRSSVVWDLREQKSVELFTAAERGRVDATERLEAMAALDTEDRGEASPLAVDDVGLVEAMPSFDKGRIGLGLHFATFACYTCGDGEWGSYSRSTTVAAHALPASIAPFATPAPWLASYARHHSEEQIGGISELRDPAEIARLRPLFEAPAGTHEKTVKAPASSAK